MILGSVDFLIVLVPFAGDHDHVVRLRRAQRITDCFLAVFYHGILRAAAFDTLFDGLNDRHRVFRARVVACDHRKLRESARDFAHDRTLCAVTIAAAAKDADDSALCKLLHGLEHVFQCIRRVRVVHKHGESAVGLYRFETAGNARERLQPGLDGAEFRPDRKRHAGGAHRIEH
ncbi:hypothetical protein SDC9_183455 [bioreactor metagenome]|uniref:Uncharacterized protein n=1 Tax=bioreactor metagenome TaxID=1076179 RepID=A0A645HB60_9ZZZZ